MTSRWLKMAVIPVVTGSGADMAFSQNAAPKTRLMDYFYPPNEHATWVYLSAKDGGDYKATRVNINDASRKLNVFRIKEGQLTNNTKQVMWVCTSTGKYSNGQVTFDNSTIESNEFYGVKSNYAIYGFDDFENQISPRFSPGAVFPEWFKKGQTVSVNTGMFNSEGALGPDANLSVQFLGRESLTVPAGEFKDCIHLQFSVSIKGAPKQDAEEWWAKGVGVIQTKNQKAKGGFTTTKLFSYDIPYEPTVFFYKARGDFGWTFADTTGNGGEQGVTKYFRVKNQGKVMIRGLKVSILGSSVFTCLDPVIEPLAPGETGEFRVHFYPNDYRQFNATIKVEERGNPENCCFHHITGTGGI